MTPQSSSFSRPFRQSVIIALSLGWVVAFLTLSLACVVFSARLDGPPALFSTLFPVGVGVLVVWLLGLIRQL